MKNIFFALLFLFSGCAASSSVNSMANQSIATFLAQARAIKPYDLQIGSAPGSTVSNIQIFQAEYVVIGNLVIAMVIVQYNLSTSTNAEIFLSLPTLNRQFPDLTFYPVRALDARVTGEPASGGAQDEQTASVSRTDGGNIGSTVIFNGWLIYQNGEGQLQS